jgi:hypothetical protein
MVGKSAGMTPEKAYARRQRRRTFTLAAIIIVLVSLTAWIIEQITRMT